MNTQPQMIIALLALLNYPTLYMKRKPNVSDRTIHRKANEVKVLEIDLPKPRGTQYERMFKNVGNRNAATLGVVIGMH